MRTTSSSSTSSISIAAASSLCFPWHYHTKDRLQLFIPTIFEYGCSQRKMYHQLTLFSSAFCLLASRSVQSFAPTHYVARLTPHTVIQRSQSTNLGIGNKLDSLFGGGDGSDPNEPKNVVDLPATTVKVGPLKFFLQIYLVAEQNKPVKGSWVMNNNEQNESLDMYYKDGTGMFSIVMKETGIKIDRYGQKPSLEYVLQESVMMHGILDELNVIAFEVEDIEKEKRLLQLVDNDAIDKARETLPAKKAT